VLEISDRHGCGDQVALRVAAAARGEPGELVGVFHALAERLEAEVAAEADHCFGDRRVALAGEDFAHERAVDLDDVDRQPLE